ncbi:phospholipid carrier-dependent glycosyltransferase [Candidatus Bathyarchaeota archaeon]|nr:MAG: phospholipid carrier-dependent glycosyltransferase [Candidatus Bathyarchaeota archaeon]
MKCVGKTLAYILVLICLTSLYLTCAEPTKAQSSTDDWQMFRHDPNHSSYTPSNSSTNYAKPLWNFTTGAGVASSPAVANGFLVVGSKDSYIYCLNASNGQLMWKFPTGNKVDSSPAIVNQRVYISSHDGWVYCLDVITGKLFWVSMVGGFAQSSPTIVDNRVFVGSGNPELFCLNASDGALIWRQPTLYKVDSSPAVSEGIVYVAADNFHVYAFNASTGNELWRTHTGSTFSSPSIYKGCVYIGSYDGYIVCLNAYTGTKIWQYQTDDSVASSPALAYGYVYVGSLDKGVYCLKATNGEKIWKTQTGYWVWSSPEVADGNVYVGSQDYNVYCFNAFTGAIKWSYATENSVDSSPAIVNGTLYFGSNDHNVYAFALTNSTTEKIPIQTTNSLAWTTVAFDVIACAMAAAILHTILRFAYSNRQTKKDAPAINFSSRKIPWFSAHIDALYILAILAFSTIFFINLGNGPLWATDEQTYSQWAYHMVKSGDYLNPWAFGDFTLWIGKPPLNMWLMSLAYQVLGVSNFSSRIVSALFGSLSLVLIFYLGKKLYNGYVGLLSAFVLGTFTTFYVFARRAMTDVPFVFFIIASFYFLVLSEKTQKSNRYIALSGLFFGLALMTKQVGALLIPLIVIAYLTITSRSIRFMFTKRFALFWGVGLLIISPWLIYMATSFSSEFWQSYVIYSGFNRTFSPLEGHQGGYLFYFSYLANNEKLWAILLPFAVGLCAFKAVVKKAKADTILILWIAIVFIVFTLAQTKLSWYILPAFPAFAISISSLLYQLLNRIQIAKRNSFSCGTAHKKHKRKVT